MKIKLFCPRWGSEALTPEDFLGKVKSAGYDGVEMGLPDNQEERQRVLNKIKDMDLQFIAQHSKTLDSDFDTHKTNYERRLYSLAETKPLFINSQTGKDYFSFEQNCELIEIAQRVSNDTGIKITHETHRGKFSFAAHILPRFLEHFHDLRLGLDISHWCCVAESLLEDQTEAVSFALSRTDHMHARIGFAEGPQIPDPRANRWTDTVERYLYWWDQLIDRVRNEGRESFTITPEFGPFPYMQYHPQSDTPLADQWDVNVYMKDLLDKRYNP